jgi:hypothetical protein
MKFRAASEAKPDTQPRESRQSGAPLYVRSQGNRTCASAEGGGKNGQSYRPLATQIRHAGFDFRQILRAGDFAVFEQSKTGRVMAYEVVHIRRHEGFAIAGRQVEPAEFYPRSEDWGTHGWTLPTREAALAKLKEVTG